MKVNNPNPEYVVLVDEQDKELGTMEKLQAHREGRLHRAVSVFIFNSEGKLLLQQRALNKYHSAGLWSNTCCSHPRLGEDPKKAAIRRLKEEMGIDCEIKHVFNFTYSAQFENNLSEYEFDHVFFGFTDDVPILNKEEAASWKYMDMAEIKAEMEHDPQQFTEWFKLVFDRVKNSTVK